MRLKKFVPPVIALCLGATLALAVAMVAVNVVQNRSRADVARVLDLNGLDWTQVAADGLQIVLSGFAPDEATRFRAINVAATVVDSARVVDMMDITTPEPVHPPRFSIEILRNDEDISLIGLVPASTDRAAMVENVRQSAGETEVTDLLSVADFPPPAGWDAAIAYALEALAILPRSKISVAADQIDIRAISDSPASRRRLESDLARKAPDSVRLSVDISAPRPVITPFTLRFLVDDEGARFDACSTDSERGRDLILSAARSAGLLGKGDCTIGLGVPSPTWDNAVALAIRKLAELGGGSVTFSDADVTLVAREGTAQPDFDRIIGELEAALPDLYSLHSILPVVVQTDGTPAGNGPPEFSASRQAEGLVQLRGRIIDDRTRQAVESYARAVFGSREVNGAMRLDPDLPAGWSNRVLVSLEVLSYLAEGSVQTQIDVVTVRGRTGNQDARAEIARILSGKLGETANYQINVTYDEKLDPQADLPTPQECVARLNAVLAASKIEFAPSSAEIGPEAMPVIDALAEIMPKCSDVPMEIGGHTDSQGREVMNQTLSQARAEAVVAALLARRILTSNLAAVGYGETVPIASNDTEEGREANRRIEFKLLTAEELVAERNGDVATAATGSDETGDDPAGGDAASGDAAAPVPEVVPVPRPETLQPSPDEGSGDSQPTE